MPKTISVEYVMDFLLSAIGTAWIQFIIIVLLIGLASLLRGLDPVIIKPLEEISMPLYQEIILPPLEQRDGGFLSKSPEPYTESSHPPLLHRFEITWYTDEQGWPPGSNITASGVETEYGIMACPIVFPFRTRFIVLMPWGGEEFICLDRFRDPAHWGLDIWVSSINEGQKWHGEHWALVTFDSRPLEDYNIIIEGRD